VARFVKLRHGNFAPVAAQVKAELAHGLAVVPMLGGYCVLAADPDKDEAFTARFCPVHQLVPGPESLSAELSAIGEGLTGRALRVLNGPAVACFTGAGGVALPTDDLSRELTHGWRGPLPFGLTEEGTELGELADDLGRSVAIVVTTEHLENVGPTVLDFRTRPVTIDRRGKLAILDIERELRELVRLGPGIAFSVLVVCTGNSCRSPMAAGMLARLLAGERVFIYSAGTDAPVGNPATAAAIDAARAVGVDLASHRARQLSVDMIARADLVLVMDRHHLERVTSMLPEAGGRTRLLLSYAGRLDAEVEDPIGRPLEFYHRTVTEMAPALERVAAEIRQRLGRVTQ